MTREKEIKIMMTDGWTREEAENSLNGGTTIFSDLAENLESYLAEWEYLDEPDEEIPFTQKIRNMVEHGELTGLAGVWNIVDFEGKRYYIEVVS